MKDKKFKEFSKIINSPAKTLPKLKKLFKNKKYRVQIFEIDPECDEFTVNAKNVYEAQTKANRIVQDEYFGWKIESIEEIK